MNEGSNGQSDARACSVSFGAMRVHEESVLILESQSVLSDKEQAGFDWYYRAEGLEFAVALVYRRFFLPTHEQLLARWDAGKIRRWRHGKELPSQNDKMEQPPLTKNDEN